MNAPARSLLGAAAGIAALTVAARVVGFGRTVVLAKALGANCVSSTYVVANSLPNVLFEIVAGGALASVVIPVLAPAVAGGNRAAVSRTASALLTWTMLVLLPVAVLGAALAPLMMRALVRPDPVCGASALVVGADMLRVFMPQVVLYGLAVVLIGVLQAHRRFVGPAIAPVLSSLVVISSYLVYAARGRAPLDSLPRSQQLVLSVGTTLGVAVLAGSLLAPLRRTGVRLRPVLRFPPGVPAQVRALAFSGLAGLFAQQAALLVALRLASRSATGPVVFVLATAVFLLPWAVLSVPVATSAFPLLAAAGSEQAYAEVAGRALRAVLVLAVGGTAVLLVVALPTARLLLPRASTELAGAVRAFAPGLLGYSLLALLTRALYARGDGRTPAVATVVGWLAVAAADVGFVAAGRWDVATSLGLGNAVGMSLAAVMLLIGLRRAARHALAGTGRTALVAAGAAALAVLAALAVPDPVAGPIVGVGVAGLLVLLVAAIYLALLRLGDPAGLRALRHG